VSQSTRNINRFAIPTDSTGVGIMRKIILAVLLVFGLGMAVAPATYAGGGPPSAPANGG
jgi:hypothetical protein